VAVSVSPETVTVKLNTSSTSPPHPGPERLVVLDVTLLPDTVYVPTSMQSPLSEFAEIVVGVMIQVSVPAGAAMPSTETSAHVPTRSRWTGEVLSLQPTRRTATVDKAIARRHGLSADAAAPGLWLVIMDPLQQFEVRTRSFES